MKVGILFPTVYANVFMEKFHLKVNGFLLNSSFKKMILKFYWYILEKEHNLILIILKIS